MLLNVDEKMMLNNIVKMAQATCLEGGQAFSFLYSIEIDIRGLLTRVNNDSDKGIRTYMVEYLLDDDNNINEEIIYRKMFFSMWSEDHLPSIIASNIIKNGDVDPLIKESKQKINDYIRFEGLKADYSIANAFISSGDDHSFNKLSIVLGATIQRTNDSQYTEQKWLKDPKDMIEDFNKRYQEMENK